MSDLKYNIIEIEEIKPDWVRCPNCNKQFYLKDRSQWSGMYHIHCGQRLKIKNQGKVKEYVWCLVSNIVERGTNRLRAKTKTYMYPAMWGDGYESIKVVGKDIETNKFIEIIINRKWLTNFRVEKVTKGDLISRFLKHYTESEECKNELLEIVQVLEERERHGKKDYE
jgi:hypothetical protein